MSRTLGVGCDTPQLYLGSPGAATDPSLPLKVLKNFQMVCSATQTVNFTVADIDVSVWDVNTSAWVIVPGAYAVSIGSSSDDIRLTATLNV